MSVSVSVTESLLESNIELVSSGWKNKRSERKARITVSNEESVSLVLEYCSEAVEKLREFGETVKKDWEVSNVSTVASKYAALMVLNAASFWALKESVRGW